MSNIEEFEIIIPNIDLPLYKYGLVHKYDINHYLFSGKKKIIKIIKTYVIGIWLFMNLIRFSFSLIFNDKNNNPFVRYDILRYFGGLIQFYYSISICSAYLSLRIYYIFNFADNHYNWFEIIKVIKGLQTIESIGISDRNRIAKFIRRIKIFRITNKIIRDFGTLFLALASITVLVINYNSYEIIYVFINSITNCLFVYINTTITAYSFLYYYIVCDYIRIRFNLMNKKVSKLRIFSGAQKVKDLIFEHNSICGDIMSHNKFWKKYYFTVTFSLIPMNLMFLQHILFEEIFFTAFIMSLIFLIGYSLTHLMFNLLTASVNREASKSYKILYRLSILKVFTLDTKLKIKVCSL